MDEDTQRALLTAEIKVLLTEIGERTNISDEFVPLVDKAPTMSIPDLQQVKRELRDVVRSLGGLRQ